MFIHKHGNEIARAYLNHNVVERYKTAMEYEKNYKKLKDSPTPINELRAIKKEYNRMINKFGANFKNNFGWASSALNIDSPNFSQIEESLDLSHYRPFYRQASYNIHANSMGLYHKLGLPEADIPISLAGPSELGIAEPGYDAALYFPITASNLLVLNSHFDSIVYMKVISNLAAEVRKSFWNIYY